MEKLLEMIKNEEYIDYLKKVISCVNSGDYYSIKELSMLKLDVLNEETVTMKKNLHKFAQNHIYKKEFNNLEGQEFLYIANLYKEYLLNEIKESKEIKEIATIEEFIQEMQ